MFESSVNNKMCIFKLITRNYEWNQIFCLPKINEHMWQEEFILVQILSQKIL